MEHYYDESGNIKFEFSDHMKKTLEAAFGYSMRKQEYLCEVRSMCMEAASKAEHEYYMHDEFKDVTVTSFISPAEDSLSKAIKTMLLSFVKNGFLRHEFKLAVWDTICAIQFEWVMDGAIIQSMTKTKKTEEG